MSLTLCALAACLATPPADQSTLKIDTEIAGPVLAFDWPAIDIGIASYEDGPTGVTVIRFNTKATATVDVRGGAPGTVNTDALRLSYSRPFTNAVVFAGGSSYGEEAITAVQTGLKDRGDTSGDWGNLAFVPGAVIYDLGGRRLNEIYPDKRLARAALAASRPGMFPLGAQGAGRMAMQGGFFGCGAHSGQGGAFRQVGATKIAAFVVVNASGAVTDRDGRLMSCHRAAVWRNVEHTADLLARLPDVSAAPSVTGGPTRNTTISLIVTNQKLGPADLQRLAVQVHMSMGRAIQPFSTESDGDTLYAASTQEVENKGLSSEVLSTIAGETMWDAILASVPADTHPPPPAVPPSIDAAALASYAGLYDFAGPMPNDSAFTGLGVEMDTRSGEVRLSPIEGGPAIRAGVHEGDVLVDLNGVRLQGLPLEQVISQARGAAGSTAVLHLRRRGEADPVELTVIRGPVHMRPLLRVEARDGALWAEAVGGRQIFEFRRGRPTQIFPLWDAEFRVRGRYRTRLAFTPGGAVLNPGRWQQAGKKVE